MALTNFCNTGLETASFVLDNTGGGTIANVHDGDADTNIATSASSTGTAYCIYNIEIDFNTVATIEEVKIRYSLNAYFQGQSGTMETWLYYGGSETSVDTHAGLPSVAWHNTAGLWQGVSKIRCRIRSQASGYAVPYSHVNGYAFANMYEIQAWGSLSGGYACII